MTIGQKGHGASSKKKRSVKETARVTFARTARKESQVWWFKLIALVVEFVMWNKLHFGKPPDSEFDIRLVVV